MDEGESAYVVLAALLPYQAYYTLPCVLNFVCLSVCLSVRPSVTKITCFGTSSIKNGSNIMAHYNL